MYTKSSVQNRISCALKLPITASIWILCACFTLQMTGRFSESLVHRRSTYYSFLDSNHVNTLSLQRQLCHRKGDAFRPSPMPPLDTFVPPRMWIFQCQMQQRNNGTEMWTKSAEVEYFKARPKGSENLNNV